MRIQALAALAVVVVACGPVLDDGSATAPLSLSFALPIECASPPADLEAVAWVSGSREPTPLEVDVAAGTTTGTLRVTTGAERRIVVDWFVEREGARVLLGQAADTLDLTEPEAETVILEISPSEVQVSDCVDVTSDVSRVGSPTTAFDGEQRPPCDLDESCQGADEAACSNLGELCAGGDPLREP